MALGRAYNSVSFGENGAILFGSRLDAVGPGE